MTKHTLVLSFVILAGLTGRAQTPTQHSTDQMNARGAHAMGFDQDKTTHHFLLFDDGGAIDVRVKTASDAQNLQAIRAHLPHIAKLFSEGDFSVPHFVHAGPASGSDQMTALKALIRYRYEESADGGQVRIRTTDPRALAAVHAFLRFQITEHKTGDSLDVRRAP
jgi:hypothetical protein